MQGSSPSKLLPLHLRGVTPQNFCDSSVHNHITLSACELLYDGIIICEGLPQANYDRLASVGSPLVNCFIYSQHHFCFPILPVMLQLSLGSLFVFQPALFSPFSLPLPQFSPSKSIFSSINFQQYIYLRIILKKIHLFSLYFLFFSLLKSLILIFFVQFSICFSKNLKFCKNIQIKGLHLFDLVIQGTFFFSFFNFKFRYIDIC